MPSRSLKRPGVSFISGGVEINFPTNGPTALGEVLVKGTGNVLEWAAQSGGGGGYSVLNGTVNPTSEGVNGDFYINTATSTIFGPKASGAWGSGTSLIGPPITGLATVAGVITSSLIRQSTFVAYTPTGTTQTVNLGAANHQELILTSATGAVTVTLTIPDGPCAGNIIVKQHASTARNLVWAVSSGTIKWLGTQPTWSSDLVSSERVVSWMHSNGKTYLSSSPVAV